MQAAECRFLTEKQVAYFTGFSVFKLQSDRHKRLGMPYHIIGTRSIRYKLADVVQFMDARRIVPDAV